MDGNLRQFSFHPHGKRSIHLVPLYHHDISIISHDSPIIYIYKLPSATETFRMAGGWSSQGGSFAAGDPKFPPPTSWLKAIETTVG